MELTAQPDSKYAMSQKGMPCAKPFLTMPPTQTVTPKQIGPLLYILDHTDDDDDHHHFWHQEMGAYFIKKCILCTKCPPPPNVTINSQQQQ